MSEVQLSFAWEGRCAEFVTDRETGMGSARGGRYRRGEGELQVWMRGGQMEVKQLERC